jgi:hypothetical protein
MRDVGMASMSLSFSIATIATTLILFELLTAQLHYAVSFLADLRTE